MQNKSVAIIPARGGSKRITRKNIRIFAGKPMLSYSIAAAVESRLYDRIIVSTDDHEIADIARTFGAEVPFFRPAELSNDFVGTDAVILHALDWLADNGSHYSYATCIYATAPFLQSRYLIDGYDLLLNKGATSVFSVASFPSTIFRSLKKTEDGKVSMFWPEYFSMRSQDLPEAFHDAGQFYWLDIKKYRQAKRLFSENSYPIHLPRYLVQDIDTPDDWEMAEKMHISFFQKQ